MGMGVLQEHRRRLALAEVPFKTTALALTGGKDRLPSISTATSVSPPVSGASVTPFSFSALGFSAGTYQHLNNYLFGPTITASAGRSSLFAHALFGEARSSLGAGVGIPSIGGISTGITSANAFAMAFGGGVDIGLTRHLAIRAIQVDYLRTQFNATDALTTGLSSSLGNRQNSFRFSTGVVFRF